MSDNRGLHAKYKVERTDGDPEGKHRNCSYFVLDLDHDDAAIPAIEEYAHHVAETRPELAKDLRFMAVQIRGGRALGRQASEDMRGGLPPAIPEWSGA